MVVHDEIYTINRGDTPKSRWIHLKVGIQCLIFGRVMSGIKSIVSQWLCVKLKHEKIN